MGYESYAKDLQRRIREHEVDRNREHSRQLTEAHKRGIEAGKEMEHGELTWGSYFLALFLTVVGAVAAWVIAIILYAFIHMAATP